jgi:hypothetical protein
VPARPWPWRPGRDHFRDREHGHAQAEEENVISLIDEALSANATIANGYDSSRGAPPKPLRGFVYDVSTGRLSEVLPDREVVTS